MWALQCPVGVLWCQAQCSELVCPQASVCVLHPKAQVASPGSSGTPHGSAIFSTCP